MSKTYTEESLKSDIVSFIANATVSTSIADKIAKQIADEVGKQNVELLRVVLLLRDYLTSDDDATRQSALSCLSTILEHISLSVLKKNDISVIFDFYQSKMEDSGCMKETLQGFNSLISMDCFYTSHLEKLLQLLKNDYQPTNYLAGTRYFAFKIMENAVHKFKSHMLKKDSLNDLYIETFILIATGEKDPRNLLLSFRMNSEISTGLGNIDKFKEELFDILFCYFPIMFKPPNNDPYKITNNDLKIALRSAISATDKFEDDAFGNLLDKLTASSPSVKNDTILTLKACVDSFSATSSLKFWLPIWDAIKFEIINGMDPEPSILDDALSESQNSRTNDSFNNYADSLSIITSLSSKLIHLDDHAFLKFFFHIFDEFVPNFEQHKDLKQCCDLLAAISKVNLQTFNIVMEKVLPVLFKETELDVPKQKLLLLNLAPFFASYLSLFGERGKELNKFTTNSELHKYKDIILMVFSKALTGTSKTEVSLRTLAIVQFTTLVKLPGYLDPEEVAMVVQVFTETILSDDNKNIYFTCLEGLKLISVFDEHTVYDVSLQHMLNLLPDEVENTGVQLGDSDTISIERILKIILDFTTSRHHLVKESILSLSHRLSAIVNQPKSGNYCFLLLSCLYSLLQNNVDELDAKTVEYIKQSVEPVFLNDILNSESIASDDHSLTIAAGILFYLNLESDVDTHQSILNNYNKRFIEDLGIFKNGHRSIVIYTRVLASLNKNLPFPQADNIFLQTLDLLVDSDKKLSGFEVINYLEMLALLTNKWLSDSTIENSIELDGQSMINLEITCWIDKGLVMRNSSLASRLNDHLLSLLSDESTGSKVASLFEVLVLDLPIFKRYKKRSWTNNARLLYKQKFFSEIATKLVDAFKNSNDMKIKSNYLTALSLVLKNTPSTITTVYIADLLPLLLQALELENVDVRVSSLQTIQNTLEEIPQLITEHVHSLIPLLLNLLHSSKFNTANVRYLALEILQQLTTNVPLNYLLPVKDEIVTKLNVGLADKKRKVRKQCIDTKQAFLELGQVPFE